MVTITFQLFNTIGIPAKDPEGNPTCGRQLWLKDYSSARGANWTTPPPDPLPAPIMPSPSVATATLPTTNPNGSMVGMIYIPDGTQSELSVVCTVKEGQQPEIEPWSTSGSYQIKYQIIPNTSTNAQSSSLNESSGSSESSGSRKASKLGKASSSSESSSSGESYTITVSYKNY